MSSQSSSSATVLVVGAGPVGLAVALDLVRQDIPVRVVTAEPGRQSPHSRAIVMWPRSLELLRRIGVSEDLAAAGHHIDAVRFFIDRRQLASAELSLLPDTPYRYGLMIPQHRTEQILHDALVMAGGHVESGVSLVGLDNSGDRPIARLRHPTGAEELVEADWVVGADGSHSVTRSQLGIEFPAQDREVLFAIGDATVGGDLPEDALVYSYAAAGALGLAPLGSHLFRVAFAVPSWDGPDGPEAAMFQQKLDQLSPYGGRLTDLRWSGVFRARRHTAAAFRAGRCLLAGDAAHVFSAAGAQGMNTGLQDAMNLGWKLGGVIRGALDPAVLETYDRERRPQVERVSLNTSRQTRWGLLQDPWKVRVRDSAVRVAENTGLMQRIGTPLISQTDVSYGSGSPVADLVRRSSRLRPGIRIPAFTEGGDHHDVRRFPAIAADRFTVLLWPGDHRNDHWPAICREVAEAVPHETARIVPWAGGALSALLGRRPVALVVRPDGHVSEVERVVRPRAINAALRRAGAIPVVPHPAVSHPAESHPAESHPAVSHPAVSHPATKPEQALR